jgi:hypothetical protein
MLQARKRRKKLGGRRVPLPCPLQRVGGVFVGGSIWQQNYNNAYWNKPGSVVDLDAKVSDGALSELI